MEENISCQIIQDLLPNYIEGIVSNESKELVSEHLDKCGCCKKEWESMNTLINLDSVEVRKIDYLKAIHKKCRNILLACIILSVVAFLISIFSTEATTDDALFKVVLALFLIGIIIAKFALPLLGSIVSIFLYKKTKKKWLIFIFVICTWLVFNSLVIQVNNIVTYGF